MQIILPKKFSWIAALAALFSCCAGASAEEIFLQNGDRITGQVVFADENSLTVETEGMGTVIVNRAFMMDAIPDAEHAIPEPPSSPVEPDPEPRPAVRSEPAAAPAAPPAKSETPEVRIEKPWQGSISGGINARKGNTSSESASGRFNVSRRKGPDELLLSGDIYFASSERRMTAMKMLGGVRYDHYFEPRNHGWYSVARFEADQDRFADINQRLTPGAGPGYAFFNSEDFKVKVETAAGFAQTNFRDTTANRFEAILIPRFFFESRIYGQSRFVQDVNSYVSLENDGYRIRSESTFEAPFFERLKLRLSLIDDYNSNPSAGAEKNDIRLISSVAYYL